MSYSASALVILLITFSLENPHVTVTVTIISYAEFLIVIGNSSN